MSHSGCVLMRHFRPRFIISESRTGYRASSIQCYQTRNVSTDVATANDTPPASTPRNVCQATQLHVAVVIHIVLFVAICYDRQFTGRHARVVQWQVVHGVRRVAGDLFADLEEARQRKIVAGQRRECLQDHQASTPAQTWIYVPSQLVAESISKLQIVIRSCGQVFFLFFSRRRSEGWPHHGRTLTSVILTESSTASPVHVLMMSIQAICGQLTPNRNVFGSQWILVYP